MEHSIKTLIIELKILKKNFKKATDEKCRDSCAWKIIDIKRALKKLKKHK